MIQSHEVFERWGPLNTAFFRSMKVLGTRGRRKGEGVGARLQSQSLT